MRARIVSAATAVLAATGFPLVVLPASPARAAAPPAITYAIHETFDGVPSADGTNVLAAPNLVSSTVAPFNATILPAGSEGLALDRTGERALVTNGGRTDLRVRTLESGAERAVDTTTRPTEALDIGPDRQTIGASGSAVVFTTFDASTLRSSLWASVGASTPVEVTAGLTGTHLNQNGRTPAVSADERYVAFQWTDYVAGCQPADVALCRFEIRRFDLTKRTSELVSVSVTGADSNGVDLRPAISADGRFVAWLSDATDLVPGVSTRVQRLYVRDMVAGVTRLLAEAGDAVDYGSAPTISDDGRRVVVAFGGTIGNGVVSAPGAVVRLVDLDTGEVTPFLPAAGGIPDGSALRPQITPDGARVIFSFNGTNLVPSSPCAGCVLLRADAPRATLPGPIFRAVTPERLLDTRTSTGYAGTKPVPGQTIELDVTGVGTTQVPDVASAVTLNVTATEATADGFVTVWPCDATRPTTSNLNVRRGQTIPNLVTVKVGTGGSVCLYTQSGTHLLADLAGWHQASDTFSPVVPERLLDTRSSLGFVGAKPTAGATVELQVAGVGAAAVPDDAIAVTLNVTATEATAAGFVTVWPCGTERPTASNLNLIAGDTRPNLVTVKLGQDGRVCLYTQQGTHLLADITAWYGVGSSFAPLVPARLLDTRTAGGAAAAAPAAGQTVELQVIGDAVPASAAAVVLNLTGAEATAAGFVTVWPCGTERPTASNLNLTRGETAPNLVAVRLGAAGAVCLYTQSGGHLIVDLAGYEG